jgi:hypothetical protein
MNEMNANGSFTASGVGFAPSTVVPGALPEVPPPPPPLRLLERSPEGPAPSDLPAGSTTSFVATAIAFVTRFFACVVSRMA